MTTRRVIHSLAAFALLAASLSASAAEQYQVAVNLLHKGKQFAAPSARVMNATPASISVAGVDGFELTFTVTDLGDNKLKIATKLDSAYGAMAPTQITVQAGKLASIALDDMELRILVQTAKTAQ